MRKASIAAAALLLAACGNDRTPVPDAGEPQPPRGQVPTRYPDQGIRFVAPGGWRVSRAPAPLVATVVSGRATVALWRYPRGEDLPRSRAELRTAEQALVGAIKARDPTFRVDSSRVVVGGGQRGVEVVGLGTNAGRQRRIRSLHLYGSGAEVVFDAYAVPGEFPRLDATVFALMSRSLRVSRPRGRAPQGSRTVPVPVPAPPTATTPAPAPPATATTPAPSTGTTRVPPPTTPPGLTVPTPTGPTPSPRPTP